MISTTTHIEFATRTEPTASVGTPELSFVIPTFNGAGTIASVCEAVLAEFDREWIQIIIVNDGSVDGTDRAARELVDRHPGRIVYVQLSRNFGEHRAVLAGLQLAAGRYTAVLDDDGQNPPQEVRRLLAAAERHGWDVVFGRYVERRHHFARRWASAIHNWAARRLLQKPPGLYLSSFKVLSRFAAEQLSLHQGPYVHLDGQILRLTRNIGQVDVLHLPRLIGRSGYTWGKLFGLWSELVLGFSTWPWRAAVTIGCAAAVLAVAAMIAPAALREACGASPAVLGCGVLLGLNLAGLGLLGEHMTRSRGDSSEAPFVIRYIYRRSSNG